MGREELSKAIEDAKGEWITSTQIIKDAGANYASARHCLKVLAKCPWFERRMMDNKRCYEYRYIEED